MSWLYPGLGTRVCRITGDLEDTPGPGYPGVPLLHNISTSLPTLDCKSRFCFRPAESEGPSEMSVGAVH